VNLNFGTSLKEIYDSEKSIIECLAKGFSLGADVTFVSKVKKAIVEHLKSEEAQQIMMMMMQIAPIFLFTLTSNVNITLEDISEIISLPQLEPFMIKFKDIFEQMMAKTTDEFVLEDLPKAELYAAKKDDGPNMFMKLMTEAAIALLESQQGQTGDDQGVTLKLFFPDLAAVVIDLKS